MRTETLRYDYTLADLHAIARLAVHVAGQFASDWRERYDTAFSAIAEHLYASVHYYPTRPDLVRAGQLAIYAAINGDRRERGFYKHKTIGGQAGPASSLAYLRYWEWACRNTPSHEPRIVERAAVDQIWPTLTADQRACLTALAVHDDYQVAADALGLTYGNFKSQVATGRRRFLALWHEGEQPSRVWGVDRRVGSRAAGLSDTCGAGHPWTSENTRMAIGRSVAHAKRRCCRACERERGRARYAKAVS
jgi:hypothetical protein